MSVVHSYNPDDSCVPPCRCGGELLDMGAVCADAPLSHIYTCCWCGRKEVLVMYCATEPTKLARRWTVQR